MNDLPYPFASSEDETPFVRARLTGLSSSLEANGVFLPICWEM